jgi:hypothetical protein
LSRKVIAGALPSPTKQPQIADYAPTADGEIAVAGPRRTAASGAAFRTYLPWLT